MADKYVKLDTVLGLIERVKDNHKKNPDECVINYGTMVGLEVELNTGELFTEQEIVKPCLEKLRADIEAAYDELDGYDSDLLGAFASRIDDLIDNLISEQEG